MKEDLLRKPMSLDIALAASTAAGVTAGVIISLGIDEATLIELGGVGQKLGLAAEGNWLGVFLGTFSGAAVMLCAVFLCGFCAIAQPFEIALAAFRGLGLGVCVRGIYLGDSVFKSMAAFLPFAALSTWVLIVAAREAFRLSMKYLRLSTTNENRLGIRSEIGEYTAKFLIYTVILAVLSMGDAFLAGLLSAV